ncbi:MAG: prephenate dehydratase [Thermoanaerobaculia bacterium]
MSRRIAFQGERGAFSEEAARRLLADGVETIACPSFEAMFEAVAEGTADCAMVPIENALAGSVHRNYDLLAEHHLTIARESYLRIVMNLIARPGAKLEQLRRVRSHPVALAQCQRFLGAHPELEAEPAYDTAGSVKLMMKSGDPAEAAIAGPSAASIYGAEIVVPEIEDHKRNYTRFLLLTHPENVAWYQDQNAEEWKTSIVFRTPDRPGALFRALAVFALRDVNLSKIESRPIEGRPWEYTFYLDLIGRITDRPVERALAHLEEMAESLRVLGSYPRGEGEERTQATDA